MGSVSIATLALYNVFGTITVVLINFNAILFFMLSFFIISDSPAQSSKISCGISNSGVAKTYKLKSKINDV